MKGFCGFQITREGFIGNIPEDLLGPVRFPSLKIVKIFTSNLMRLFMYKYKAEKCFFSGLLWIRGDKLDICCAKLCIAILAEIGYF